MHDLQVVEERNVTGLPFEIHRVLVARSNRRV